MKEDFLHYIWLNKQFDFSNLKTSDNQAIQIISFGHYLQQSTPDFFNAQLIIENQKWAGNIEIHLKSSDWYLHHHEKDDNYNNVILHVVWEHDAPIFRKDNSEIPVLILKNYVSKETINNYQNLISKKNWIFCENQIKTIDSFVLKTGKNDCLLNDWSEKSLAINELLLKTENDWETVLFCFLAKNFGLNTNGEAFFKMAQSIGFSVVRKEAVDVNYLEALFFGQLNLLENSFEDSYIKELQSWYEYLTVKYKLEKNLLETVAFFKHRPDNFPTIRLAQLAMLYHKQRNLFSKIIEANSVHELYKLFDYSVSDYWKTHYNFDKQSKLKEKTLSKSFIDLLIINTIIPIKFAYENTLGKENIEDLIHLISQICAEKNAIIDKFNLLEIKSKSAFETQSLLQLKNEYCNHKKCLKCGIGIELLKN